MVRQIRYCRLVVYRDWDKGKFVHVHETITSKIATSCRLLTSSLALCTNLKQKQFVYTCWADRLKQVTTEVEVYSLLARSGWLLARYKNVAFASKLPLVCLHAYTENCLLYHQDNSYTSTPTYMYNRQIAPARPQC